MQNTKYNIKQFSHKSNRVANMVTLKIVSGNKCSMDSRSVEVNFSFSVRSTHIFVYDVPEELHGISRENALCRIDGNTIFLISIERTFFSCPSSLLKTSSI